MSVARAGTMSIGSVSWVGSLQLRLLLLALQNAYTNTSTCARKRRRTIRVIRGAEE